MIKPNSIKPGNSETFERKGGGYNSYRCYTIDNCDFPDFSNAFFDAEFEGGNVNEKLLK